MLRERKIEILERRSKGLMIRWLSYRTGASMSRTLRLGIGISGVRKKKKIACSRYSVGFETNLFKWVLCRFPVIFSHL